MIRSMLVVVILGLAVVGIMGYNMEDEAPAQPLRFVYEAKTGSVVFDHKQHVVADGAKLKCAKCHHLGLFLGFENDNGIVEFDHETHSTSEDYGLDCDECHHAREEGTAIRSCDACHSPGSDNNDFVDEDADHQTAVGVKCMECHEDLLEEEDGCATCHSDSEHAKVHEPMSCHECHSEGSKNNTNLAAGALVHKSAIGAQCDSCHADSMKAKDCAFCHKN